MTSVLDVTRADASRPEWLAWRRGGIGGSDIAALAGLSRWASPTSLYYEKLGVLDDDEDRVETNRQRLGRRAELMAAAEFNDHTGLHLIGAQSWCERPQMRHHRCTIDAFVGESPLSSVDDALGGEETKTTGQFDRRWSLVGIPDDYACQVQWGMHVTNLERWWLLVFYGLFDAEVIAIERNQQVIDDLVELAERFWRCVRTKTPPPADAHEVTTETLLRVYPVHSPHTETDLDDLYGEIERFAAVKAELKELEAEETALGNQLRQALGDAEVGLVGNEPAVTWRAHIQHRLDSKRLKAAEPDTYSRFEYASTQRPLKLVTPKKRSN